MMEPISTDNAPKAVGPYSQALKHDNLVFTAGQIGVHPITNNLAVGFDTQAKQALENLKAILEASGSSMENALKVTVYLKSMEDYAKMNEIYAEYFKGHPARTTVEVARLPKDALVEIDVIATCD